MKKDLLIFLLTVSLLIFTGCTENARVKTFGGSGSFELPKGEKLVNVTWKNSDMWYLSRPMHENEFPETYTFQEKSSFGIAEGTFTIYETK